MGRKKTTTKAAPTAKPKTEESADAAKNFMDAVDAIPLPAVLLALVVCGLAMVLVKIQAGEMSMPAFGGAGGDLAFEHIMSDRPPKWYTDQHEVTETLPAVTNVDHPFSFATHVTTATFQKEVVEADPDSVVLVVFYDPRSHAFQQLHEEIDAAAQRVGSHPRLASRARICVVNAAVDAWLGELYAPLGVTAQETTKTTMSSFQFGRESTFMMLSRVFRAGRVAGAYKGIYEADDLLNFLELAIEPLEPRRLPTAAALTAMVSGEQARRPALAACTGVVDPDEFAALAKRFHGKAFFALVDDATACNDGSGEENGSVCALVSYSPREERKCFHAKLEEGRAASSLAGEDAEAFIRLESRTQLEEIREDNMHVYMRKPFICVLLLDLENIAQYRDVSQIAAATRKHERLEALGTHIEFVLADAKSMAEAYDLADDEANAILFQSSLITSGEPESVYSAAVPAQALSAGPTDAVVEAVTAWLSGEIGDDLDEFVREHALFVQQGGLDRAEQGALSASASAGLTDVQKKQPELAANAKPQVDFDPENEVFELSRTTTAYAQMSIKQIMGSFRELYAEYALLEEIWEGYSAEEKRRERALRDGLEMVRNYIKTHKFLHEFVQTIPLTPRRLRELLETKGERKEFLRAVERLDVERVRLANQGYEDEEHGSQDGAFRSARSEWADSAYFLEFALYDIYSERSVEYTVARAASGATAPPEAEMLQIDRRSADELTMEEFAREYAGKGKPVIIENAHLTKQTWNLTFFKERCGGKYPNYVTLDRSQQTWGGLVSVSARVNMSEFVDTHRTVEARKGWYVHDWSLPRKCPEVFGEAPYEDFVVPKYFAGDYTQRLPFEGYQHTWPSLFVGANGTQSLMHVDSGGTNFWMYLVSGVKEWRFFERRDIPNLYARPLSASFAVDPFEQDGERFPLVGKAKMYHGMQRAGDLVFVPGGSPHGVRNHDDVVGLSMNYVDDTNMWLYLWSQLHNGNYRAFETLTQKNFPRGLRKDQEDLPFGRFKSTDWYKLWKQGDLDLNIDNYK